MTLPSSKISVLRSMMGFGEDKDAQIVVPQNSVSTIRQKGVPVTENLTGTNPPTPGIIPAENTLRRSEYPANFKCPHCENMAKNFLYLESLIRSNYDNSAQCSLCYSALKYLQYVNKSIMQVFGNFDSIVQAAKAFSHTHRARRFRSPRKVLRRKSKMNSSSHSNASGSQNKPKQIKKKTGTLKSKNNAGGSKISNLNASKNSMKTKAKTAQPVRTAEGGAFENGSKVIKGKKITRKPKAATATRGGKVKATKTKRKNV